MATKGKATDSHVSCVFGVDEFAFYRSPIASLNAARNASVCCAPDSVISLLMMKKGTPPTRCRRDSS